MRRSISSKITAIAGLAVNVLACTACALSDALALPPKYEVRAGHLILNKVSADCPVIYDNDWWTDVPDAAYVWTKASQGKCNLRGNIVTRDCFDWEKGYAHKYQEQIDDCQKLLKASRASGLRNIPDALRGAEVALKRPPSGKVEDTTFVRTAGSDLIVSEARKATPSKPLLLFVGGSCGTVATAYLTDPAIASRVVVFQIDGGAYNGSDGWAWEIAMKRLPFANWARGYFWDKIATWRPDRFRELPDNPLGKLLKEYAAGGLAKANQWGDGPWAYWLFSPGCLKGAEDYDGNAITVPAASTDVRAIEEEFFRTMVEGPLSIGTKSGFSSNADATHSSPERHSPGLLTGRIATIRRGTKQQSALPNLKQQPHLVRVVRTKHRRGSHLARLVLMTERAFIVAYNQAAAITQ